jgi:hypothetical protein
MSGQRLLRKADFHLGQHINTFFRIRCKLSENFVDKKHVQGAEKRHITMFGMCATESDTSDCCLCSLYLYNEILKKLQLRDRTSAIQMLQESTARSIINEIILVGVEPRSSTLLILRPL